MKSFISACDAAQDVRLTHFIRVTPDGCGEYVVPPYSMDTPRLLFSMTKSITALAIGMAAEDGLLDLDLSVLSFFPDKLPENPSPNLPFMSVRHLLTMSCGITRNTYDELYAAGDWVSAFLAQELPVMPGTCYIYSTHAYHMLSSIFTAASGELLADYVQRRLFTPLGITEAVWERAPDGLTAGGMGLSLTPRSVVWLARLLLDDGQTLIPRDFLRQATSAQIIKPDGEGYGFGFHVDGGCYYLDGAFGQLCVIHPQKREAYIAFGNSKGSSLRRLIRAAFIEPDSTPFGVWQPGENPRGLDEIIITPSCVTLGRESINYIPGGEIRGVTEFVKDLQLHRQPYVCRAHVCGSMLMLTVTYIETPYTAHYSFTRRNDTLLFVCTRTPSLTPDSFTVTAQLSGAEIS